MASYLNHPLPTGGANNNPIVVTPAEPTTNAAVLAEEATTPSTNSAAPATLMAPEAAPTGDFESLFGSPIPRSATLGHPTEPTEPEAAPSEAAAALELSIAAANVPEPSAGPTPLQDIFDSLDQQFPISRLWSDSAEQAFGLWEEPIDTDLSFPENFDYDEFINFEGASGETLGSNSATDSSAPSSQATTAVDATPVAPSVLGLADLIRRKVQKDQEQQNSAPQQQSLESAPQTPAQQQHGLIDNAFVQPTIQAQEISAPQQQFLESAPQTPAQQQHGLIDNAFVQPTIQAQEISAPQQQTLESTPQFPAQQQHGLTTNAFVPAQPGISTESLQPHHFQAMRGHESAPLKRKHDHKDVEEKELPHKRRAYAQFAPERQMFGNGFSQRAPSFQQPQTLGSQWGNPAMQQFPHNANTHGFGYDMPQGGQSAFGFANGMTSPVAFQQPQTLASQWDNHAMQQPMQNAYIQGFGYGMQQVPQNGAGFGNGMTGQFAFQQPQPLVPQSAHHAMQQRPQNAYNHGFGYGAQQRGQNAAGFGHEMTGRHNASVNNAFLAQNAAPQQPQAAPASPAQTQQAGRYAGPFGTVRTSFHNVSINNMFLAQDAAPQQLQAQAAPAPPAQTQQAGQDASDSDSDSGSPGPGNAFVGHVALPDNQHSIDIIRDLHGKGRYEEIQVHINVWGKLQPPKRKHARRGAPVKEESVRRPKWARIAEGLLKCWRDSNPHLQREFRKRVKQLEKKREQNGEERQRLRMVSPPPAIPSGLAALELQPALFGQQNDLAAMDFDISDIDPASLALSVDIPMADNNEHDFQIDLADNSIGWDDLNVNPHIEEDADTLHHVAEWTLEDEERRRRENEEWAERLQPLKAYNDAANEDEYFYGDSDEMMDL